MTMHRGLKIGLLATGGLLGSLVLLLVLALIVLQNFDWNRAKPWLHQRVSEAIDRPFSIEGPLTLSWNRPADPAPGWRGRIPWPELLAQDVRIGYPAGFAAAEDKATNPTGTMARAQQIRFSINPLPLLNKEIVVPLLELDAPQVSLQRLQDGANNWSMAPAANPAWRLDLQAIRLKDGIVRLQDAQRKADLTATINSLEQNSAQGYGIRWSLAGTLAKDAVRGTGQAGSLLSLQSQGEPYPLQAQVMVGKTSIAVVGHVTRPQDLAAMDVRLKLSGASMGQLYNITGMVMPETPAYFTEGRLHSRFDAQGGNWTYENFSGRMGSSDISGTINFLMQKPRPRMTGTVVSNLLRLEDLAPAIGADDRASKIKREADIQQPVGKLLPVERFKTERWSSIDADVSFTGKKIVRKEALPIDSLRTHIKLQEGVLKLEPLNFGVAGGTIDSVVTLDGRQNAIKANMRIEGKALNLGRLFPTIEAMQGSLGQMSTNASLSATGDSVASILGNANGELKMLVDKGTISKLMIEKIGLNLGNVALATILGDKQIKLNCMAGDFTVTDGLMRARSMVVDTEEANLHVAGTINLADEKLALVIKPRNKGLRLITLRTPLYVTGSFSDPAVTVDKGVVAAKAGAALALAVFAPFAAILPVATLGGEETSECARLLTEARIKPQAPPPGKLYHDTKQPGVTQKISQKPAASVR